MKFEFIDAIKPNCIMAKVDQYKLRAAGNKPVKGSVTNGRNL